MQQRSHITRPAGVCSIILALACQFAAMAAPLHGLAHGGEHHGGEHHGGHECTEVATIGLSAGSDGEHGVEEPSCLLCRAGLRGATALLSTGDGIRPMSVFTPLPDARAMILNRPAIGLKPLRGPPAPIPSGVHR